MNKPKKEAEDESPWRKGSDVRGIVPPGRRLAETARPTTWSASGVRGIQPPGTLKPGEGAATRWILEAEKRDAKQNPPKRVPKKEPPKPKGPTAPPKEADPKNVKEFLDLLAEFMRENTPKSPETISELLSFVGQSARPFEIIVSFTIGSSLIGNDQKLRSEHQWALERGAKAFFNLARRLDPQVRPPRGLVPETLDPLFFDVPDIAYQLPFAYLTMNFLEQLEVLRIDFAHDRKLIRFAKLLYARFIEGRTFGDRKLTSMFVWEVPAWAPDDD